MIAGPGARAPGHPIHRPERCHDHRRTPQGTGSARPPRGAAGLEPDAAHADQRDAGRASAAPGDLLDFRFKPVELADLRPPAPVVREDLRDADEAVATLRYRLRNSSQEEVIENVVLTDTIPDGVTDRDPARGLRVRGPRCAARSARWRAADRERWRSRRSCRATSTRWRRPSRTGRRPLSPGDADNILTNLEFTWENFREVFDAREFWTVIWATLFYTIFGTCGALIVGLFAALLLNKSFRGQGVLRGLYLFPYVAPVIAVAFSWVILFDPFSGS
jgi:multiple sugar transport system permease protein